MTHHRFRRLVPLVLALGMLASGCFQIRSFTQKPATLAPGEVGTVLLRMHRVSQTEGHNSGYTFLLIGIDEDLSLKRVGNFDTRGNFGGPFARVRDNTLRTVLRTAGNCEAYGVDAAHITGMTWHVFRTERGHDTAAGGVDDPFAVQVRLKRVFADPSARGDFVIFSGTWADVFDANGIADPGETRCVGMVFSSFSASD